ncbi:MAG: hypothetical protein H6741_27295 [Alphaproteobacteria bacterium]|nr:hypothetical protein [Alphaproteobacteria bacterium]
MHPGLAMTLAGLLSLNLVSCADDPAPGHITLSSFEQGLRFDERLGTWEATSGGELFDGDEVLADGWLFHVDGDQLQRVAKASLDELEPASWTWEPSASPASPDLGDWVLTLSPELRHERLRDVPPGTRIAFEGRVFDTRGTTRVTAVRATGEVVTEVVDWMQRTSEAGTIRVRVETADGASQTLVSTAEHPFYLPDRGRYVELGELEPGDRLLLQGGREAWVAALEVISEPEIVYNFEVDGTHNYFVRAEAWGGDGVLVHNATRCRLAKSVIDAMKRSQKFAEDLAEKGVHVTRRIGDMNVEMKMTADGDTLVFELVHKARFKAGTGRENARIALRDLEEAMKDSGFRSWAIERAKAAVEKATSSSRLDWAEEHTRVLNLIESNAPIDRRLP